MVEVPFVAVVVVFACGPPLDDNKAYYYWPLLVKFVAFILLIWDCWSGTGSTGSTGTTGIVGGGWVALTPSGRGMKKGLFTLVPGTRDALTGGFCCYGVVVALVLVSLVTPDRCYLFWWLDMPGRFGAILYGSFASLVVWWPLLDSTEKVSLALPSLATSFQSSSLSACFFTKWCSLVGWPPPPLMLL